MYLTKAMNHYWVPLKDVKQLILNGRPLPVKGWQFYRDENGAVVTMDEKAMIEPQPVVCQCGCGYDPFYIREHLKEYPDAICPICYDKGEKVYLLTLVLKRV